MPIPGKTPYFWFMYSSAKSSAKKGLPPGTLVHIGPDNNSEVIIRVFLYDNDSYEELELKSAEQIPQLPPPGKFMWIDIDGNHDAELMEQLGQKFDLHPLLLADAMSSEQRTKLDVMDDALFLVMKMIYSNNDKEEAIIEQVSFYLKKNILLTFQEKEEDVFEPIRNRIRQGKGRVRKSSVDYLFYALIDAIVDNYIVVLELIGEKTEWLEGDLMKNQRIQTLESVYDLKRELLFLRKSILPLKEIVVKLQKEETGLISDTSRLYLKDLFDHVVQVSESIETFREMNDGLMDMYMMLSSNAMNQVVKTLTIISTIFIPLTFIVGVYGMNFEFMPELKWKLGYCLVWALMLLLTSGMLYYFKKKKWF
jgi:magnesium transporter